MSGFTFGHLPVAVMRADTKATLEEIRGEAIGADPKLATLGSGWGSIQDDESVLGGLGVSARPLAPDLVEEVEGLAPEHLMLRLYFYATDLSARKIFGTSASAQQVSRLQAIDVLLARQTDASLLVLVSTRQVREQNQHVIPALQSLLTAVDPTAQVQPDTSPLDLGTPDIFLWLMWRWSGEQQLGEGLKLIDFRDIRSRDALRQGSTLSDAINLARRELLALITNENTEFGPAKFAVQYDPTTAALDLELTVTGSFTIHTSATHYSDRLGRDVVGPRAVVDAAFGAIPGIRAAYEADKEWRDGKRDKFIEQCWEALAERRPNPLLPETA